MPAPRYRLIRGDFSEGAAHALAVPAQGSRARMNSQFTMKVIKPGARPAQLAVRASRP